MFKNIYIYYIDHWEEFCSILSVCWRWTGLHLQYVRSVRLGSLNDKIKSVITENNNVTQIKWGLQEVRNMTPHVEVLRDRSEATKLSSVVSMEVISGHSREPEVKLVEISLGHARSEDVMPPGCV